MGAGFVHNCDNCGYSVNTSGPWEFYRDKEGNRKPYGHPGPMSREAKKRGIWGFSEDQYCPKCDEVFDVIVVEFAGPNQRWAPKDEYKKIKCPKCGVRNLIFVSQEGKEVTCPRCRKGKWIGRMEYIS